jgi:hypothetical protein
MPEMLRAETSFQDSPGDGYYFVLFYNDRPLQEQLIELGLKDGDTPRAESGIGFAVRCQ